MKVALVVLLAALSVGLPLSVRASQSSQRVPVAPSQGGAEGLRLAGGGVPSGYMILGETQTAPPGYMFNGLSVAATGQGTWSTRAPMPTNRYALGAATVNGIVYAIGGLGSSDNSPRATVEAYDPATDSWSTRAPMLTDRFALAVVAVTGRIYAIGGRGSQGNYLTAVEEYDPAANVWAAKTPMPTGRYTLTAATASNGRIYAIGGDDGNLSAVVEEYDPATDQWTAKAPMPTPRFYLGAVALGARIYAVGGETDHGGGFRSTVETYDPVANTWSSKVDMPTLRMGLAVAVAGGAVFALGGNLDGTQLAANEEFDAGTVMLFAHRRN